ncbi:hypothetical protein E2C01_036664 [Portunus trituberculatus]|uniref:Uncharacterized protein n=1 Tax=Portunus trituberculatus TaxID=210409 RepID=A0A5B7FCP8_PORTR|nr:hypothetical protein [Portunus trituberculatus]
MGVNSQATLTSFGYEITLCFRHLQEEEDEEEEEEDEKKSVKYFCIFLRPSTTQNLLETRLIISADPENSRTVSEHGPASWEDGVGGAGVAGRWGGGMLGRRGGQTGLKKWSQQVGRLVQVAAV